MGLVRFIQRICDFCVWFLSIGIILEGVDCYNLEDRLPLFKYGEEASSFGFSVAQHRLTMNKITGAADSLLVVGAPTAKVLPSLEGTVNYTRPGGVFYCPVSTNPSDCRRIQLDASITRNTTTTKIIQSGQWLGVSLKSKGPGDFLVTCAHRYARQTLPLFNGNLEDELLCGKCFLMKGTSSGDIVEIAPFNTSLSKYFISSPCDYLASTSRRISKKVRFGYTQAGSSLSMTDSEYLLGGPGAWRWSGSLFAIEMPTLPRTDTGSGGVSRPPDRTPDFFQSPTCPYSEWRTQPNKRKCNDFPLARDSYMGFSVATSDSILATSNETFYVAGSPRGNNTGAVVFFKKRAGSVTDVALWPDYSNIVMGEAVSSSFGYSIALTDLNGDGLDDLIVGAPQYFEKSGKRKAGGAVYIYKNEHGTGVGFRHVKPQVFYGPPDSYFGHTVAALGDIDQDGYNDFAVGAPYEDGNGVVHVYRGSRDGILKESQVISGKKFPYVAAESRRTLKGFGASLSGILDADSNKYPDLLIGSLSDHVALIRSRPIIGVNMSFDVDRKEIDLHVKDCAKNKTTFSCFKITYCFEYRSRHSEYTGNIGLNYALIVDNIRQEGGKVSRISTNSSSLPLRTITENITLPAAGKRVCPGKKLEALFLSEMKDHLSDIGVKINFHLITTDIVRERRGQKIFDMIKDPILDAEFENEKTATVKIKNTCGADGCQSKLKINASMPEEIILGNMAIFPVKISISNPGEEAHQARFLMTLPSNVLYHNVSVESGRNSTCAQLKAGLIECDVGNPFKPGETSELLVNLDVSSVDRQDKNIQVKIQGYTTSANPEIPEIILNAKIFLYLDILVTAYGEPEQVMYTQKKIIGESIMNFTDNIGPSVGYTFDVKNQGTQTAPGLILSVNLPYEIYNGKWLLYLVAAEVTSGGGVVAGNCKDNNRIVNTLGLQPSFPVSRRSKRAAGLFDVLIGAGSVQTETTILSCGKGANCIDIQCSLEDLPANGTLSVKLYSRLWEATFLEEEDLRTLDLVHINTAAVVSTTEENVHINASDATVRTTVDHAYLKDDIRSAFPWWYILIAVILLLLLYILIIFILIKCGFFKRKRYPRRRGDADETEPQVVQ